jgi:hypothetical protein
MAQWPLHRKATTNRDGRLASAQWLNGLGGKKQQSMGSQKGKCGRQKANGAPKGKWGAIKAYGATRYPYGKDNVPKIRQ